MGIAGWNKVLRCEEVSEEQQLTKYGPMSTENSADRNCIVRLMPVSQSHEEERDGPDARRISDSEGKTQIVR